MGFFKNLFEKKTCDLCGGEIGMLGNRKLADGNCCKECAKKLSPWFTDRKESTVEEIRSQLQSREENRRAVAAFHTTRSYGKSMMLLIDEDAGKFMVTQARDLEEANPDVLDLTQITACDVNVQEAKNEVYHQVRDQEGKLQNESFSPRRYRYSYDFKLKLRVNHPYIEEIAFSLSGGYFPVRVQRPVSSGFLFNSRNEEYGPDGSSSCPPTQADFQNSDDYVRYERWGREIREILLSRRPRRKTSPLESLLQEYKQLRAEDAAGDPARAYELMQARKENREKLYAAWAEENPAPAGKDGSIFTVLLAQLTLADQARNRAQQQGSEDGILLADNAKEVIMEKLIEARNRDPEGFQKAGVLEALGQAPAAPAAPQKVTCPYCGSLVDPGKFCGNCGARLED